MNRTYHHGERHLVLRLRRCRLTKSESESKSRARRGTALSWPTSKRQRLELVVRLVLYLSRVETGGRLVLSQLGCGWVRCAGLIRGWWWCAESVRESECERTKRILGHDESMYPVATKELADHLELAGWFCRDACSSHDLRSNRLGHGKRKATCIETAY